MVFMVLEILDAQSGSTTGTSLVTTADVHPVPELDLEVKLEQEEGEEGGGDDDVEEVQVESAASALLLLFQPKTEPFDISRFSSLWEGKNKYTFHSICAIRCGFVL